MSLAKKVVDILVETGPSYAKSLIQTAMPERRIKAALEKTLQQFGDRIEFTNIDRWNVPGEQQRYYSVDLHLKPPYQRRINRSTLENKIKAAITKAVTETGFRISTLTVDHYARYVDPVLRTKAQHKINVRVVVHV